MRIELLINARQQLFLSLVLLAIVLSGCNRDDRAEFDVQPEQQWALPSTFAANPALDDMLAYYDGLYNPVEQMLRFKFQSPGYHSNIASGTPVHQTRESLFYALGLLQRDQSKDRERAINIIEKVLSLQDRQPASTTYGLWPWLLEEPLQNMAVPDFNWADFCGATIGHILVEQGDKISPDTIHNMKASLEAAAIAIRKRDVKPGYTNVAVLGGGVCAIAGEVLSDEILLSYGRKRLQRVVEYVAEQGSFTEYNSPPYTKVVIAECERILQLVDDVETRRAAESLRHTAWKIVAQSFHAGTQQWAGPHSRTSRNRLRHSTARFLSDGIGQQIVTHPNMSSEKPRGYAVVSPQPCPLIYQEQFRNNKSHSHELRTVFSQSTKEKVIGSTWFTESACLGSVSRSSFWTQRKPVIGYWKTDADPAVVFRVQFLHDGKDFASMAMCSVQAESKILLKCYPLQNRGDWHRSLDRPNDRIFHAEDFRLRFEVRGKGVAVEQLSGDNFQLMAGRHKISIYPLAGKFAGREIKWEAAADGNHAFVDGVCYQGLKADFSFDSNLDCQLAAGLELLPINEQSTVQAPEFVTEQPGKVHWEISPREKLELVNP